MQRQVGIARTCEEKYQGTRGTTGCTGSQPLGPLSAVFVGSGKLYGHNSGGFVGDLDNVKLFPVFICMLNG